MPERSRWRRRLFVVIFESNTRGGRVFDVVLLAVILAGVAAVSLESVAAIQRSHGASLRALEWIVTALFTIEYALRLISAPSAARYAFSFFGLVDVMSVVPAYASLVYPGAQSLVAVRVFRLIRVFRILKLGQYLDEAHVLGEALRASRAKITVFLTVVATIVVTVGAAMYLIEGEENGFSNIPRSMYWTVVTLTTVGYGDIAPKTPLGQMLASLLMILGYGILAVPPASFPWNWPAPRDPRARAARAAAERGTTATPYTASTAEPLWGPRPDPVKALRCAPSCSACRRRGSPAPNRRVILDE